MPMTRRFFILSVLISFTALTPVAAQAQGEQSVVKAPQSAADGPPPGPMKDWIDAENALIDPLSDKDLESFYLLRMKYAYISGVRVAEHDIGNAVKSCGEKNPGIKDKMDSRFKQWQGAINPILDTADKTLDREIDSQKIVDAKKVRNVFNLQKTASEHSDKQVTKTVITTEDACEDLLDSMDDTEDRMISILQDTLLPESVIQKRTDDMVKAEEAAKTPTTGAQSTRKDFGRTTD